MDTLFTKAMDDMIISNAMDILRTRISLRHYGSEHDAESIGKLLVLQMGELTYEVFDAMFFNKTGQLLKQVRLARGTVDSCVVYVRELVREAILCNAVSVVIAHNHPSGGKSFSMADIDLTCQAKAALATVSIRLIDHILVSGADSISFRGDKDEQSWA